MKNNLKIDNIDIFKVDNKELKGIIQFTINDSIRISGVKLYIYNNQYVVKYPINPSSKKNLAFIFPLDNDIRIYIENLIIDKYESIP